MDATAPGGDVESLVAELRSANAAGTERAALIAELLAGVERAEDDDEAEVLRTVRDRVTGFCTPHARIDLTDWPEGFPGACPHGCAPGMSRNHLTE